MTDKRKNIIILTYQPLNSFISKRFGIKTNSVTFDKKYWYLLPIIDSRLDNKYKDDGHRNTKDENFLEISSIQSLIKEIKKLKKNFYYINFSSGVILTAFIEVFFKIKGGKKIEVRQGFTLGNVDGYLKNILELMKFDFLFAVKKIIISLCSLFKSKIIKVLSVKPEIVFCSNQLYYDKSKKDFNCFKINSFDYNTYLEKKDHSNNKNFNKIIFLDSAIESSFEFNLLHASKNYFDKKLYWQSLLKIFEKIEKQDGGNQIQIAAHMRRNSFDLPINRKFIFERTPELIKESKLVICHNSLSLQWAILFQKPIILINIENFNYLAMRNNREINNLSKELDLEKINVDRNFVPDVKDISLKKILNRKINFEKYDLFTKKYINFNELEKKPEHFMSKVLSTLENFNHSKYRENN